MIRLKNLSPGLLEMMVQVTPGVRPFESTYRYVPKDQWRPLSAEETEAISRPGSWIETIFLVAFSEELLRHFREEVFPCLFDFSQEERRRMLADLKERVLAELAQQNFIASDFYAHELMLNESGNVSTSYDHAKEEFVGLHIDTHQAWEFSQRRSGFHFVGLNLGTAERYFEFIDLNAEEILEAVQQPQLVHSMPRLTAAFLSRFPDYPVYRCLIPPGYAYLAATQFLIHDGATNTRGDLDVVFLLAAHFSQSSVGSVL